MILSKNFEEILSAFQRYNVDYIIVGGYAVIFHGYVRTTGDLDIWVNPSEDNMQNLIQAFEYLNLNPELTKHLNDIDFNKPFAIKIGDEPLQVDLMNAITGLRFDKAKKNSISIITSSELEINFIHLDDLITNKMLTGRLKDKADVEELQKIRKYSDNK